MNVLVACEESQAVTIELRKLGVNAFSCDTQECSGGHPEWHIMRDVLPLLNGKCEFDTSDGVHHKIENRWDMIIAFPPCTYMTNAGAVRMRVNGQIQQKRYENAMEAKKFFMRILETDCEKIAIENPTPMKLVGLPQYSQAIHPWMFGEAYTKRTCLWLKGLPLLVPPVSEKPDGVTPYVNGGNKDASGNYRKNYRKMCGRNERNPKTRAKTFPGIAKAMSEQWVEFLESEAKHE